MIKLSYFENLHFQCLCGARDIDPLVALESEAVLKAIEEGDTEALIKALDTEF
jgi:hypothetical protein